MNYKTMKVPEDVWRSIKIGAARDGVTMIEYLRLIFSQTIEQSKGNINTFEEFKASLIDNPIEIKLTEKQVKAIKKECEK